MMTLTRPLLASHVQLDTLQWRANPDRARHARWGSTRLQQLMYAPTARLGLPMTTLNHKHLAWGAWPASTQRLVMMVRVLRVVWVASDLRPVVLALQFVKHVKPASTAPKARACVRFVHLARQTKTPMHRHHAHRAPREHTLAVARPRATSVLLVRSTATRMRPRRARHAWQVSTGRLALR